MRNELHLINPGTAGFASRYQRENRIFAALLFCCLTLFFSAGWYLRKNNPPQPTIEERASAIQTKLVFEQKQRPATVKKTPPKPKEPPQEAIDLTRNPVLQQKQDDIVEQEPKAPARQVRRVYGLRRVYSTGIGASGSAADAVVGKLGNTLDTDIDTFTATSDDLVGELVSVSSVEKAPRLKSHFKPQYTPEMIANRVEGVIKAKVLVDADGRVKKAILLNDLGYGSREKALEAVVKLEFDPALRDGIAMAVWIIVSFRFQMLDS